MTEEFAGLDVRQCDTKSFSLVTISCPFIIAFSVLVVAYTFLKFTTVVLFCIFTPLSLRP